MSRESQAPLRGVRRVDDAGTYWCATLTCGHAVYRSKSRGRLTVFSNSPAAANSEGERR
jgi:hypothetical protein